MAQYPQDEVQASLYSDYDITNSYQIEEGLFCLPVAEETPTDPGELADWSPVAVVRAHAPFRLRTVSVNAKKKQTPPVLPKPADTGAFRFLGATLSVPVPTMTANLTDFDWTASGQYTFVEDTVSRPEDGYVLGAGPWTLKPQIDNFQDFGVAFGAAPTRETGEAIVGGAIAQAGPDAVVGQVQANQIDFTKPYWYNTPSFAPGVFFSHPDMLNSGKKAEGG